MGSKDDHLYLSRAHGSCCLQAGDGSTIARARASRRSRMRSARAICRIEAPGRYAERTKEETYG
jgi:hypothetical protein